LLPFTGFLLGWAFRTSRALCALLHERYVSVYFSQKKER